jgi:ATP phosphoribosyltransferase
MEYLTFALAKGRLADKTMALLEKMGITCDEMKEESRKLIFVNEELKYKFFLAKASDVPTYVEYGAADIGIVGKDTILEEGRNIYEVLNLNMGKCRFAVAGYSSVRDKLDSSNDLRVATKYPNIAKEYFYQKKHQTIEIVKLHGSVELAPIVGLADVIVDIVETGSTLKANGLEVLEDNISSPISARMVVNRVSMKLEHERIARIINGLRELTGDKND